jgi:hypothetical protein
MRARDRQRYRELIDVAACVLAFHTAKPLPRVVHELLAEAADLRHGWQGYNPDTDPGETHLPVVDEVIDAMVDRANVLRRELVARLHLANVPASKHH